MNEKVVVIKIDRNILQTVIILAVLVGIFTLMNYVSAATPNPGHDWSEIGNVLVTPSQGGTGWASLQANTVLLGNGTTKISTTSTGTNGQVLALVGGVPSWVSTTTLTTISGTLPMANGGTNNSLTPSAGGILWTDSNSMEVMAGTATAGQALLSGAAATPTWTTATFPSTAGTAGNVLMSNGTNWVSAATSSLNSVPAVVTYPVFGLPTGSVGAHALAGSLTSRDVGYFRVTSPITINQISVNIGSWTAAGVLKVCIYDATGANKLIDLSTASIGAAGNVSTAVSPAVTLQPGNYYDAVGCASGTCTMSLSVYSSGTNALLNGAVPTGKLVFEGTVAHTSGTCNTTLGTITGTASRSPIVRLDN